MYQLKYRIEAEQVPDPIAGDDVPPAYILSSKWAKDALAKEKLVRDGGGMREGLIVRSADTGMTTFAGPGDWLVLHPNGLIEGVSAETFSETYEESST